MSLGYPTTKADIDSHTGGLAVQLRNTLVEIGNVKLWLDAQSDADLEARGYSSPEVATLKAAMTDLDKLARIYVGTEVQAVAYDFRTFAKSLTGLG